ncbi:DHA2 family efflux MFS transporter permease subunit [Dictyobacter arantiisoli]|uniref:MFS transporter n=1 Tax=Dictyobacter arantiisoli TaxID=2014874 RepID=A0A5A5TGG3_9CHLR|nr:DHA2 family efflux MFS transporter permease subunit [Dictyobacter arantiisoli]GCF10246.1 MFS transporter [Dictyobacter arantiisoli]
MQVIATPPAEKTGGLAYKWIVAIVIVIGLFMTILDSTIVNTAIPKLETNFGVSLTSVQWVLTAYTLAQGVATPLTAYLASRIGNKRLYLVALAGFTIGSALCGISWSLPTLIAFRVIQAVFGAFISPLAITLLYSEFPPAERGTAMGFLGIPLLLGPALGPTVGGYLVTYSGWQLIFYINVPIGIVGLIAAMVFLNDSPAHRVKFDFWGFIFAGIGLASTLYGLSSADSDGWGSATVMGCIGGGVILLIIFVFLELQRVKQEKPVLLDLRVFSDMTFTTGIIASSLVIFSLYGGLFVIPVYLQSLRGLSAFQSGLDLLPQSLCSMVAVVIGGRLVDKMGVRTIVIPGLLVMGFAMYMLTFINSYESILQMQIALCIRGFGLGFCMQPLMMASLSQIKPKMLSQASAVNTTFRFVISSLAVSVISTFVSSQTTRHYANIAVKSSPDTSLGRLIQMLQAGFMARGFTMQQAMAVALKEVSGLVKRQAYVQSISDTFWLTLILIGVAVFASIFVGGFKKKPQVAPESLTEEEQKALEEAAMAV